MRSIIMAAACIFAAGCASNISYWTTPSLGPTGVAAPADPTQLRCIKNEKNDRSTTRADNSKKLMSDWQSDGEGAPIELADYLPKAETGDIDTISAIAHAALLMEVSYCEPQKENERKKREDAALDYRALAYDAAYFHPRYYGFLNDPNLFLLGRSGSNELTVIFTGTEVGFNPFDIIQDLRTGASFKGRKDGKPYVPRGHTGFRSSFRNVIRKDFFDDASTFKELEDNCRKQEFNSPDQAFDDGPRVSLANFICRNDIHNGDPNEKIKVTIIGHSLGAGIAQMSLGAFEGLTWRRENVATPQVNPPKDDWPFEVKAAYLFAPPLALYPRDKDCDPFDGESSPIMIYKTNYKSNSLHDRTYTIIRDGDMVPAIWNPLKRSFHCVEGEHFGTYVRIPRGNNSIAYIERDVDWPNPEPHLPGNYRIGIEKALEALKEKTLKSNDAAHPQSMSNYN